MPFSEFMAGMQDDRSVPKDPAYTPVYVAVTWESMPNSFFSAKDALTRAEILGADLLKTDPVAAKAVTAVAHVARGAPAEELKQPLYELCVEENVADPDEMVQTALSKSVATATTAAQEETQSTVGEASVTSREVNPGALGIPGAGWVPGILRGIVEPIEHLVFGRLIGRGTSTGTVLHGVLAKLMKARRAKYCLVGNSLGAHVLCGALSARGGLPFKTHTVFFAQGAVESTWFNVDGRYAAVREQVAGPVVCTTSDKDTILSILFESVNDFALGRKGFPTGTRTKMRAKEKLKDEPYLWANGDWNIVYGSQYIDEGSGIAGGHGDFKEDETTMTYWSAINLALEESLYDLDAAKKETAKQMLSS